MSELAAVAVSIVRLVREGQPNFVQFVLDDALGNQWRFEDKVPILSLDYLEENSAYPVEGQLRCAVLKRFVDESGRPLAVIDTELPDHVETLNGEHIFTVSQDQLSFRAA